jgi:hypothetical protein
MQLVPGTQVVPVEAGGNHADARSVLHHRVVDRDLRAGGECFGIKPVAFALDVGALDRQLGLGPDLGLLPGEFGAHFAGAEHEDAGIPEEPAGTEKGLGRFEIGFFAKPRHVVDRAIPVATLDIAILGFRPRRRDADGHDAAALGKRPGAGPDHLEERAGVGNLVVRWQHQNHPVRIGVREVGNGGRYGCGGVANERFEHIAFNLDAAGFALLGQQRFETNAADDPGWQIAQAVALVVDPFKRVGQQGLVVDQLVKLFRFRIPRHWPEPGPCAATQDNRRDAMACDHEMLRFAQQPVFVPARFADPAH